MPSLFKFIVAGAVSLLLLGAAQAQPLVMTYDEKLDQISIQADSVSLAQLTSRLTKVTGIESRVDPAIAGDRVSVQLVSVPLDEALRQMFRRYSYLIHYGMRGNPKRIGSVALLPRGNPSDSGRIPVSRADETADNNWQYQNDGTPVAGMGTADSGVTPVVPANLNLDDLSPEELVQLSGVVRAALPVRPPVPAPHAGHTPPSHSGQPASDSALMGGAAAP